MKKLTALLFILAFSGTIAHAQTKPLPAEKVIQQAGDKALKENKKVLLMFHASWCGWCHKMDASLKDASIKKYFDDNFVIEHLTVDEGKDKKHLENPGGEAMKIKYNGKDMGLPFWVILDAKGNLLFDSKMKEKATDGNVRLVNIGCPASDEEVAAFTDILKKTTKLSPAALKQIAVVFSKNKAQ